MKFFSWLSLFLALHLGPSLWGQSVAITLDDAPNLDTTPLLTGEARNQRLLEAFQEKGLRVALFANGIRGGESPDGLRWLEAWGRAGHLIGNHTFSHKGFQEIGAEAFKADLQKLDPILRPLPGFWPRLRFPFLQEGRTPEERSAARKLLANSGYTSAPVSIPSYDWIYNERLHILLKAKPDADTTVLRTLYLQHLARMLDGYRALGRELLKREVPHTLLLHHNLLNALMMPDILRMLEQNGWKVIDPAAAYRDPFYSEDLGSAGYSESLLGAIARGKGVFLDKVRALEAQQDEEIRLIKEFLP